MRQEDDACLPLPRDSDEAARGLHEEEIIRLGMMRSRRRRLEVKIEEAFEGSEKLSLDSHLLFLDGSPPETA